MAINKASRSSQFLFATARTTTTMNVSTRFMGAILQRIAQPHPNPQLVRKNVMPHTQINVYGRRVQPAAAVRKQASMRAWSCQQCTDEAHSLGANASHFGSRTIRTLIMPAFASLVHILRLYARTIAIAADRAELFCDIAIIFNFSEDLGSKSAARRRQHPHHPR